MCFFVGGEGGDEQYFYVHIGVVWFFGRMSSLFSFPFFFKLLSFTKKRFYLILFFCFFVYCFDW